MCGIVCYIGDSDVKETLIEGLFKLEYRGYDSAGLSIYNKDKIETVKQIGRVYNLEKESEHLTGVGHMGIAHTRWATHGGVSILNAHPQTDSTGNVLVVHNGIIENYSNLKNDLVKNYNITLKSDTDTELIAHYISIEFKGNLVVAVRKALRRLEGTFGVAVMHKDVKNKIIVARQSSPIILGLASDGIMAASDVAAITQHTDRIIHLEDGEMAELSKHGFNITTLSAPPKNISRKPVLAEISDENLDKNGFPHFMLKEIYEQPHVIERALKGRLDFENSIPMLGGLQSVLEEIKVAKRLVLVSCGTSYYAAYTAKYIFEHLTDLDVKVELASEFRYNKIHHRPNTLVLFVSQSGETADTYAAALEAKRKGFTTLGAVNVVSSSIARETDAGVYIRAGLEVGVASTKCFTAQLVVLTLIALFIGRYNTLTSVTSSAIMEEMLRLPEKIYDIFDSSTYIEGVAEKYHLNKNWLFLARKHNYPIALEGALKLKEISYIHAEGYAAGEMKHGPIALVDDKTPSLFIAPNDVMYNKVISNMNEIKSRGGPIIAIATRGDGEIRKIADDVIYIPETLDVLNPILAVIPCQLLAYYCANFLGRDIDRPRNLAKCVTVE